MDQVLTLTLRNRRYVTMKNLFQKSNITTEITKKRLMWSSHFWKREFISQDNY